MRKHFFIAAFCSLSFLSSAHAITLLVEGQRNFIDASPVYACLAYQSCADTQFRILNDRQIAIDTSASFLEVYGKLLGCELNHARVREIKILTSDQAALPLHVLGQTYEVILRPAMIEPRLLTSMSELEKKLTGESELGSQVKAILDFFLIKDSFYSVETVNSLPFHRRAETDHNERKIRLLNTFGSESLLEKVRIVRHEYDHILQVNQAKHCVEKNQFDLPEAREKAAYLNDGHFLQEVVGESPDIVGWTLGQVQSSR